MTMAIHLAGPYLVIHLINIVGSNLKRMEGDLGINITSSLENIVTINKLTRDTSNDIDTGKRFYPLQTCPDVCGVIQCGVYVSRLYFVTIGICGLLVDVKWRQYIYHCCQNHQ